MDAILACGGGPFGGGFGLPALLMAAEGLKPGGMALIKVFQGSGCDELRAAFRHHFATVRTFKPEASRAPSPEPYLLAKDFTIV